MTCIKNYFTCIFTVIVALIVGVTIVGCGGSSGSTGTTIPTPTTTPTASNTPYTFEYNVSNDIEKLQDIKTLPAIYPNSLLVFLSKDLSFETGTPKNVDGDSNLYSSYIKTNNPDASVVIFVSPNTTKIKVLATSASTKADKVVITGPDLTGTVEESDVPNGTSYDLGDTSNSLKAFTYRPDGKSGWYYIHSETSGINIYYLSITE